MRGGPESRIARHRGLAVCCIPKVANTSIKRAVLRAQGIDPNVPNLHGHPDLCMDADVKGYFVAAFLRDPVERLYSLWCDKIRRNSGRSSRNLYQHGFYEGMSFADFVRHIPEAGKSDIHLRGQHEFLPAHVDFWGRFERLDEDWAALQRLFRWLPNLERANAASDGDWRAHCDDETADLIRAEYPEDFALHESSCRYQREPAASKEVGSFFRQGA